MDNDQKDGNSGNTTFPADAIIAAKMEACASRGRGFILEIAERAGLAEGGKEGTTGSGNGFSVEVKESLPPIDNYEPPTMFRSHLVEDAVGFIAFANKYGTQAGSLVLFNDEKAVLSIDELKQSGQRELVELNFAYSDDWKAWEKVFKGPPRNHKELLKFLLIQQHNMVQIDLLESMRSIKATAIVKQHSELKINSKEVGVTFAANADESLVNFPRLFQVTIPVLDIDVDQPPEWRKINVRVEVHLPDEATAPVRFELIAPELLSVRRARVNAESLKIKEALEGWTVIRGTHRQTGRPVGRPNPKWNTLVGDTTKSR